MDDPPTPIGASTGIDAWAITSGVEVLGPVIDGLGDLGARVQARTVGVLTQGEADALVEDLVRASGGSPALVVMSVLPDEAMRVAQLSDTSAPDWKTATVDGLRTTLYLLRALGGAMKGRPGAVVLVGPTLSLVGCPGMVALTTLLEGQRGMVKSVARQWGSTGVTLNWAAISPRGLAEVFDRASLAVKPDAVSIALGNAPDPRGQIAGVLAFLASPAGRAITGATLTLDGGEWMVP